MFKCYVLRHKQSTYVYIKAKQNLYSLKKNDLFLLQTVHAVAPSSLVHLPVNALIHSNDAMEYLTVGMDLTK